MYAANSHDHISDLHHELPVTGNANEVTFLTFQDARKYPQFDIPFSIVLDGMQQDADPGGIILYDLHERLHLTIRDDCRNACVVILDQMKERIFFMQVLLKKFRASLKEDKTTD
jgi:hypothetical protein